MNKEELIQGFDPNAPALNDHIYGLPFQEVHAEVIILPVPWEVTVSYAEGTAKGPSAIKEASQQVDLYDPFVEDAWKLGVWMAPIDRALKKLNKRARKKAVAYLEESTQNLLADINSACEQMVIWTEKSCTDYLEQGKLVALLGGDHSTPLGYLKALATKHESFGILQIDAHADLRIAYEGFEYSHASIMYNALKIPQVEKLVQVGIRDYCQEEVDVMNSEGERVKTFFDRNLKYEQFRGKSWQNQVVEIVTELPQKIYLSFDIDGLDPKLCPNTGTPVAGGFETDEVLFLVEEILEQGKQLIGFDLNEVSPGKDEWDANVGARLLYRLCNILGKGNNRI